MSKKFSKKPLMLAMGAAFALSGTTAHASLFQVADLASGYMVAQATPATPATPAAPAAKAGEASCGAACVKSKTDGGMKEADAKAACDKMAKEGKCGGDKKKMMDKKKEGKCGEGKCGGKK